MSKVDVKVVLLGQHNVGKTCMCCYSTALVNVVVVVVVGAVIALCFNVVQ
jgi:hypothetical protein